MQLLAARSHSGDAWQPIDYRRVFSLFSLHLDSCEIPATLLGSELDESNMS
jgi:hypothetical protein